MKPFAALVKREEQYHPEGVYALRIGRNFRPLGRDPETALIAFEREKKVVAAKAAGIEVLEEGLPSTMNTKLDELIEAVKPVEKPKREFKPNMDKYLDEIKEDNTDSTYRAYKTTCTGTSMSAEKVKRTRKAKCISKTSTATTSVPSFEG